MAFLEPPAAEPPVDCSLCPRLAAFRDVQKKANPDWNNAPVPILGDPSARLLIVGLAPGRKGANRTGRAFTGDAAGVWLYETLTATGFASGSYDPDGKDELRLHDAFIVNAVRCLPPENKPTTQEVDVCARFLRPYLSSPSLRVVVALGGVAHRSVRRAFGIGGKAAPFGHGLVARAGGAELIGSYHCSRYNTQTGRLTRAMFTAIFERARTTLEAHEVHDAS